LTILLTLFAKVYNKGQLKQIEATLQTTFEDLDAQIQIIEAYNRWVKIKITGEDENVAKNYIAKQIGICPINIDEITIDTKLKGYIKKIGSSEKLSIDIGITEPNPVHVHIPLITLQNQLLNGKEESFKKIVKLFALSTDLPISIRVNNICIVENTIEAELSQNQVEMFKNWQKSLLDRLIILGITTDKITEILERTRLNRDVINIESLGLFEQVLTCKLGTDAAGLIPRIGHYMRNTKISTFNSKNNNIQY